MNKRKDTGTEWNRKKRQVVEMLATREMTSGQIAKELGISPARVYGFMCQIPDDELLYEDTVNGVTVYGRLVCAR